MPRTADRCRDADGRARGPWTEVHVYRCVVATRLSRCVRRGGATPGLWRFSVRLRRLAPGYEPLARRIFRRLGAIPVQTPNNSASVTPTFECFLLRVKTC